MDIKQLREYLPTHPAAVTVYGWVRNGKIPFRKAGKRIFFDKEEIDSWTKNGGVCKENK